MSAVSVSAYIHLVMSVTSRSLVILAYTIEELYTDND